MATGLSSIHQSENNGTMEQHSAMPIALTTWSAKLLLPLSLPNISWLVTMRKPARMPSPSFLSPMAHQAIRVITTYLARSTTASISTLSRNLVKYLKLSFPLAKYRTIARLRRIQNTSLLAYQFKPLQDVISSFTISSLLWPMQASFTVQHPVHLVHSVPDTITKYNTNRLYPSLFQ